MGKDKRYKRRGAALTTGHYAPFVVMVRRRRKRVIRRPGVRKRRQRGGILPLFALAIPGLISAGKAAALGGVGAAAGYGVKKGLEAATRRQGRR